MRAGNYPTPAQVSVFMGDIWLDDAYRIEYRDQNPLIPIYGYAESEFTAVAQGKRIVQGSIIINYRYPEYLRAAIDGLGKKRTEMDSSVALAHALRNTSLAERVAALEQARMEGVGKELGEVFIEKYASGPYVHDANEGYTSGGAARHLAKNTGVNIPSTMRLDPSDEEIELRIWFDTPSEAKYYSVIEGVRLVGRAVAISNAAHGAGDSSSSGQNLFELYTFFARRIINRRVQNWEPDVTLTRVLDGEPVKPSADPVPSRPAHVWEDDGSTPTITTSSKWYVWKTGSFDGRQIIYMVFGKHEGDGSLPGTVRFRGEKEYIMSWDPTLFIGTIDGLSAEGVILADSYRYALTEPGILGQYEGPIPLTHPVQDINLSDLYDADTGSWTDLPSQLGL